MTGRVFTWGDVAFSVATGAVGVAVVISCYVLGMMVR